MTALLTRYNIKAHSLAIPRPKHNNNTMELYDRVQATAAHIRALSGLKPTAALILGTGLGELPDDFRIETRIAYEDIEGFPNSSAPGHAGELTLGTTLTGQAVAILRGRFHLYEGYGALEVVIPIYVLAALGVKDLIVTNAAGALNPAFRPGDVMLIQDHLNFTGHNPLVGVADERLGVRFPDMSDAYSAKHQENLDQVASSLGVPLRSGIYAGVLGPSLETSAERRYLRRAGADAVGMSTVMEVIAANHCGMGVAGMSAITNLATGDAGQQPDTIEQVLENATIASESMNQLIPPLLNKMETS